MQEKFGIAVELGVVRRLAELSHPALEDGHAGLRQQQGKYLYTYMCVLIPVTFVGLHGLLSSGVGTETNRAGSVLMDSGVLGLSLCLSLLLIPPFLALLPVVRALGGYSFIRTDDTPTTGRISLCGVAVDARDAIKITGVSLGLGFGSLLIHVWSFVCAGEQAD